jgi:capsular exopolysaccharide synthesis family protein
MQGAMDEYTPPASRFSIRRFVFFLRKFWWVPLITLFLAIGAEAAYIYYWAPPNFISTASMWETEKLRLPEGASFTEDLQNYMGTQMELLRNDALARRVVARLQAANSNSVPLDEDGRPIKVKITVKQPPKSSIFMIEAVSANPAYTPVYLDTLLNEYLEYKKNVRKTVSGDTLASISEQVLRMERDLKEEQADLTAFERSNNIAILQEEATVSGAYLAKLQTELSDLKLDSQLLDATSSPQGLIASGDTNGHPDSTDSVREFGSTSNILASSNQLDLVQEIQELKMEREKINYRLPTSPRMVELDGRIARDEKSIEMFRDQEREKERVQSRQNIQMKMQNVMASIKEWEAKVVEANSRIAEADHFKLSVNRTQSLYDRLVMLLENVDISRNIDQETLTILEPASPARRSYSDETTMMFMSAIGGLAFGLGVVALVGIRDDRFNSLAEVNEKFGDVIVGQVPDMPMARGKAHMPLLEAEDERDMYAESYRSLRSAIFFMPREGERPKLLLVTSALPNEGKSTIAANLARTLALAGSRVLLVDGDLRRGYLHDLLGMRLEPGLADLLDRPNDLEAIIQHDSLPNFAFLSRGKSVPNPGDLFLTSKLDQIFTQFREKFDYVLIDTSPIFATDDAASLAPKADGTLFVVRSRFSSAGAVKEALDLLSQRQVRVLGLVFNRADSSARNYYYYKNTEYYRPKKTA